MPPLLLDLHQMVDLALSVPESGLVNITVLHALMHVIIHKLEVQSYRVEFRGERGQEIEHIIPTIPLANVVSVVEYSIADPDLLQERIAISDGNTGNIIKTILSLNIPAENSADNRFPPGFPLVPLKVPTNDAQQCNDISIHDMLAVTLPADQDLLGTKQAEQPESLSVMWGMINVSKRVDAVEVGLQRFAELLQTFGKDLHQMSVPHGSGKHKKPLDEKKTKKTEKIANNGDENEIKHKNKKKKKPENLGNDIMDTEHDLAKEKKKTRIPNDSNNKQGLVDSKTNVEFTDSSRSQDFIGHKNKNKKKKPENLGNMNTEHALAKEKKKTKNQIDLNNEQSLVDSKTNMNITDSSRSQGSIGHVQASEASNFEEDSDSDSDSDSGSYESGESAIFQREILLNQKAEILAAQNVRIEHITTVLNGQISDLRSAITEEYTTQYSKFNTIFMQTMQKIQDMLDAKVDKLCIPPLKQYIADELLRFRKRLEMFAQEFGMIPDAAGTQVIRNVNCISCQRTVNQKDREKQPVPLMDRSRPLKFVQTSNEKVKHRYYGGSSTMTTADERIFRNSNIVTGQSIPQHEYTTKCGNDGRIYQSAAEVMCSCNH